MGRPAGTKDRWYPPDAVASLSKALFRSISTPIALRISDLSQSRAMFTTVESYADRISRNGVSLRDILRWFSGNLSLHFTELPT